MSGAVKCVQWEDNVIIAACWLYSHTNPTTLLPPSTAVLYLLLLCRPLLALQTIGHVPQHSAHVRKQGGGGGSSGSSSSTPPARRCDWWWSRAAARWWQQGREGRRRWWYEAQPLRGGHAASTTGKVVQHMEGGVVVTGVAVGWLKLLLQSVACEWSLHPAAGAPDTCA